MKRVLLFKDEQGFSDQIGHIFVDRGYHVTIATKLQVARRLVERGGMDLVVADILDLNSIGLKEIKQAKRRGVQIFLMSNNSSSFGRQRVHRKPDGELVLGDTDVAPRHEMVEFFF